MSVRYSLAALAVPFAMLAACGDGSSSPATAEPEDSGTATPDANGPPQDTDRRDAATVDADSDASPAPRDPVVFVHGINGSSANFTVMIDRLVADGWRRDWLSAIDFADPAWGCNADNANAIKTHVEKVRATTGAKRVDLVAHSMGTLSSRRFVKVLGGTNVVATYVTLGGMHHGLSSSCLNPLPVCVWQELCGTKPYLTELNTAPTTPEPVRWVSIYSKTDSTVPPTSAHLDGAENIEFDGVDHSGANGLLERPEVYAELKRVLGYSVP